jgi:hypothetical protein
LKDFFRGKISLQANCKDSVINCFLSLPSKAIFFSLQSIDEKQVSIESEINVRDVSALPINLSNWMISKKEIERFSWM